MILLGNMTMNMAEKQKTMFPSNSKRKPNHALELKLWKSISKLDFTRLMFFIQNSCFLNARIVMTPEMLSEKWWMTNVFVIESRRVKSREEARK